MAEDLIDPKLNALSAPVSKDRSSASLWFPEKSKQFVFMVLGTREGPKRPVSRELGPFAYPRRAHSAALTADNEMWIFSGYDGQGGPADPRVLNPRS